MAEPHADGRQDAAAGLTGISQWPSHVPTQALREARPVWTAGTEAGALRGGQAEGRADPVLAAVPRVGLGGLPIAVHGREAATALLVDLALHRRGRHEPPAIITSANGQVLSLCARDPGIRRLFEASDLIHADGAPLVFASYLRDRDRRLPERVATTDLFHDVAREAVRRDLSFYMLGSTQEGMGVPREQAFALRWQGALAGVGVIKTSGGLFDFLSGARRRAPDWMQRFGLEWVYRASLEPARLLPRYAVTNPHAIYLLLTRRG